MSITNLNILNCIWKYIKFCFYVFYESKYDLRFHHHKTNGGHFEIAKVTSCSQVSKCWPWFLFHRRWSLTKKIKKIRGHKSHTEPPPATGLLTKELNFVYKLHKFLLLNIFCLNLLLNFQHFYFWYQKY